MLKEPDQLRRGLPPLRRHRGALHDLVHPGVPRPAHLKPKQGNEFFFIGRTSKDF